MLNTQFFHLLKLDEKKVSRISAVIMLRRSDKQPDRVEISPEQLSAASTEAEISFPLFVCANMFVCGAGVEQQ